MKAKSYSSNGGWKVLAALSAALLLPQCSPIKAPLPEASSEGTLMEMRNGVTNVKALEKARALQDGAAARAEELTQKLDAAADLDP